MQRGHRAIVGLPLSVPSTHRILYECKPTCADADVNVSLFPDDGLDDADVNVSMFPDDADVNVSMFPHDGQDDDASKAEVDARSPWVAPKRLRAPTSCYNPPHALAEVEDLRSSPTSSRTRCNLSAGPSDGGSESNRDT
jgi:hypothetical protein